MYPVYILKIPLADDASMANLAIDRVAVPLTLAPGERL
jgi:hypothetical protein